MILKAELRGMATAGLLVLAALLLLVAIPTGLPGVELLQSLRFHLAALGLPLVLLLLVGSARWRALLAVGIVLASVGQGAVPILDGYRSRAETRGDILASLKVLSFNVLSGNLRARDAVDFIIAQQPDIAVIMEAPGVRPYLADLARTLPYRLGCDAEDSCDIAVFSRTPLLQPQMLRMPPYFRERLAVARTMIAGQSITVAGIHLSKPYFDEAAAAELYTARRVLQKIEGPLFVSGDFNAAAWSDAVARFSQRLQLVPPPYYPATWPVKAGDLGVPIDNMFTRGGLLIDSIAAPADSYGSNHRALLAQVGLRATP